MASGVTWAILNDDAAQDDALREALDARREEGHRIEVRVIREAGQGRTLGREAVEAGAARVAAAGGDGTANEVVAGVVEAGGGCSVGLIPFGTGNDFATAAGIPVDDPAAALDLLLTRPAVPVDLGRCNGRVFLNMATGGFPAELTSEVDPGMKSVLGRLAYALSGLARVAELRTVPARITADGAEVWSGGIYAVAVGNGRLSGGGVRAAPWALVNDGLLDLMVLPEQPGEGVLDLMMDHRRLLAAEPPETLRYHRARRVEVESPEPLQVNLDGQPLKDTRFTFEILPGGLEMHLPEDSPLVSGDEEAPEVPPAGPPGPSAPG